MATDGELAVLALEDFLSVCHLRQAELLSHLRTHLRCVAVNSLTTTDHYVHVANLLDGCSKSVRCSECVGTCKQTVGKQPACICTAVETLANNLCCTRRTHCQNTYC